MTQEEVDAEVGRAFREKQGLVKKIACLQDRIRRITSAASTLAGNPIHAESLEIMDGASDIREDVAEIRRCKERVAEIDRLLY